MAVTPGGEFSVNTSTNRDQNDQQITTFGDDGRYVIVWEDDSGSPDDTSLTVRAQVFEANGVKVGGEILVPTTTDRLQINPAVAALGDGFVIAWNSSANSGTGLFAQRFDGDGAKVGGELTLRSDDQSQRIFHDNPELAATADGGVVMIYGRNANGVRDLYGLRLDAAGQAVGSEFLINDQHGLESERVDVAALKGGGFVVVWDDRLPTPPGGTQSAGVYMRRFDASGQGQGGQTALDTAGPATQGGPAVAALQDGGYVVVWGDQGVQPTVVRGQRFAADGALVGAEFVVANAQVSTFANPEIVGLANGGWAVTWTSVDNSGAGIGTRFYDAAGAQVEGAFLANTAQQNDQAGPAIAAIGDAIVVTWQSTEFFGPDTSGATVKAQSFSVTVTGPTNGDDQLKGTATGDTIDGLGGADLIEGFEGDDTLLGGAGNDWLVGGTGGDRLNPGDGVNVLDGGDGLDFADFSGRAAGVWADLAAVAFSDATTWATYVSIEGLIGTDLPDALYGNGADNTLRGGAGDDALDGRAGADTLEGGTGNDYLVGGDGTDILRGGDGVDGLVGGAGADLFDLGAACGWDVAADYRAVEGDRIALGAGQKFQFLLVYDIDGDGVQDSQLSYSGGTFVALGVNNLDLSAWNELVI